MSRSTATNFSGNLFPVFSVLSTSPPRSRLLSNNLTSQGSHNLLEQNSSAGSHVYENKLSLPKGAATHTCASNIAACCNRGVASFTLSLPGVFSIIMIARSKRGSAYWYLPYTRGEYGGEHRWSSVAGPNNMGTMIQVLDSPHSCFE